MHTEKSEAQGARVSSDRRGHVVCRRAPDGGQDILDAIGAVSGNVARDDLSDGLILDAAQVRLIEIGEAFKAVSPHLRDTEPGHTWTDRVSIRNHRDVKGMRSLETRPARWLAGQSATRREEGRSHPCLN
jgi:hypothetical protein